jgi:hypothetical protein
MGGTRVKLSPVFIKLRIVSLNGANMRYILFILLIFGFGGCANHISNSLKSNFSDGKSIVIVPRPIVQDKRIYWSRMGDDILKDYFSGGYRIDHDYMAIPVDAGIYYARKLSFVGKNIKNITDDSTYISDVGYVTVTKVSGKGADSFLFDYDAIGFITIEPYEVVLIPSVSLDVDIVENSCRLADVVDNGKGSFLFDVLISNQKTLLGKVLDAALDAEPAIQEWRCPIGALYVTIETKSIDDFISRVDNKSFPNDMLNNIQLRDFQFGKIFENAQKLKTFIHGIEQYEIKSFDAE